MQVKIIKIKQNYVIRFYFGYCGKINTTCLSFVKVS